jgi:hypothetical protein
MEDAENKYLLLLEFIEEQMFWKSSKRNASYTGAHHPDLVEENSSAIGDFEQSGLGAVRFVESPAPIPAPRPAENRERIRQQKSGALPGLLERFRLLRTRYEKNPGHGKRRIVESRAAKYQLIATIYSTNAAMEKGRRNSRLFGFVGHSRSNVGRGFCPQAVTIGA